MNKSECKCPFSWLERFISYYHHWWTIRPVRMFGENKFTMAWYRFWKHPHWLTEYAVYGGYEWLTGGNKWNAIKGKWSLK